ncbi:MAG TPA: hypothetical protein PLP89_01060 [Synergistales bacterium]|jgi:hypothetical protein|nr:hypothetical protein [Synergistales bacterium]HRV71725.1 hypothetical protein [Thermovirgaceae bacterium]
MGRTGEDLAAFSRVLSSALLLCGFIVFGVAGGRALVSRGYPGWTLPAAIAAGTLFGAWQAWSFLKTGIKKRDK